MYHINSLRKVFLILVTAFLYPICLYSIFLVTHNEFLSIWLQIIVFLFFLVSFFMCWLYVGYFSTIQSDYGWSLALGGTFIFLLSSALTLSYILFYSTGPAKAATLEILNYCGILVLIYFLGYVLLALEYAGKPQQGAFQFIFAFGLIGSILIICLVNLKLSPYIAFIWTTVIILYAIAFDYYNYADTRQKDMLYV